MSNERVVRERAKELRCLRAIAELLSEVPTDDDVLPRVIRILSLAYQYPCLAAARLEADGKQYQTPNFHPTPWRQRADILIDGDAVGLLEVVYLARCPEREEGPFLLEERILIDAVAKEISFIIKSHKAQDRFNVHQEQLRRLAAQLTVAEERERRRIAHDLHDRISQSLVLSKLKLEALRGSGMGSDANGLEAICLLLQQTIEDSRSLMFELSPPMLYEHGLVAAVRWLAEHFQQQFSLQVAVHSDLGRILLLDEERRVILYRTVQELLTNVVKHSCSSAADVTIEKEGDLLTIVVEDHGCGFEVTRSRSTSFGLFSIRERLEHLGIQFGITSSPGSGTLAVLRTLISGQPASAERT